MPRYDVKCARGHEDEVKMGYDMYDRIQRGEERLSCPKRIQTGTHFTDSLPCPGNVEVVLTAMPHVFAVNDGDFQFSKKKFGMGNLTEI